MKNLLSVIISHKHELILIFLVTIYIIYFTTASFLRYENFYAGRFDLGNMDQIVWNTAHGRTFQATNENGNTGLRLADHADFILLFLSPSYFIWEDPRMLLLIQTIVVAFGAFLVFLIAKKILKNKNLSLLFSVLFLLNPSLERANLYDFHGVVLATTFLLAAFYFLFLNKFKWVVFFVILAGITKEQVWIIIAFIGLYIALLKQKKILGFSIFTASVGIFYLLIWHIMPGIKGMNHFALSFYSDFGDSPSRVVKNIIFSPIQVTKVLFHLNKLEYIYKLFVPIGFISILSPLYLLFALPDLFINLLSNNGNLHQIDYQYTSAITPFIFIAAIFSLQKLKKKFPNISYSYFSIYLILAGIYSYYMLSPLPGAKNPNLDMITKPQEKKELINFAISQIPENASVAATNNLGAHVAHRKVTYTIPLGIDKADIVMFLLNDPFAQPSLQNQKEIVKQMKKDENYNILFDKDDFIVFKKKS